MSATCAYRALKLPQHIAIIMDGNGRWAKQRHLPRMLGHQEGVKAVRKVIKSCSEMGIKALTLFAFSSENWQRPEQEVNYLMTLFLNTLKNEIEKLAQNNVQLKMVGNLERFNAPLRQWIDKSQALTAHNTGLQLIIAVNYSGQWDIVQAAQKLIDEVKHGAFIADQLTQEMFANYLSLAHLPALDLLIRTSGEYRISNFLLWQLAYTELYFTDTLWPDFDEQALQKALHFYAQRERRFGCTSEQLTEINAKA
ncbi:isoprenyl transferase [Rickettsiella grylli]|uniref:Ditrans,polycis-undecaprenyl-diphosphate synthase ((2E,6E)-farnesyl-diphosphate specific) n=1 Tax=Rickettsiella grylli TaxID=59196 RepID=A8PM60_9COXI|nr:isoprenyl transferase [Rickettsiella grylli]EDP46136.1 di-trans,poly-cis-decaprenylcistransferase [Rickettsiella grylli]